MYRHLFAGTPYMMQTWETILLVGFILVTLLALLKRPSDFPLSRRGIVFLTGLWLMSGVVGAKLLYIYLNQITLFEIKHLSLGDAFVSQGYAFLGALFAEVVVLLAFTQLRFKRINFFLCADYFMPFLMLHQAIVRIGCFLNGCCYGKLTELPWGCVFSEPGVKRHPTQLYEAVILFTIFFLGRALFKKKSVPQGVVFFGAMGMYTALRFFVEFFRVDSFPFLGSITFAQVALFTFTAFFAAAIAVVLERRKRQKVC